MCITRTIISEPLRAIGVGLWRAAHYWTGRHYRRALIRRELRRIGRQIAAERSARDRAAKPNAEIRGQGADCGEGTKRQAT